MKIALLQLDIKWNEPEANRAKADFFIRQAAAERCDLVVLPEAFTTGFPMLATMFSEYSADSTTPFLSSLARELNINIIAGFLTSDPGEQKGRNIAVAIDRKGLTAGHYSKMYMFTVINEADMIRAGEQPAVFSLDGVAASIFICYDIRFPEIFRTVAPSVQCVFVIANWLTKRIDHWAALLKARAIENQCFVFGINRVGTDGNNISYPGRSLAYDPWGYEICSGGDTEGIITCDIDPDMVTRTRERFPFLLDMRHINISGKEK
jgi:omega-amidase